MNWLRMTKDEAKKQADEWREDAEVSSLMSDWSLPRNANPEWERLRRDLVGLDERTGMTIEERYGSDLEFALGLYRVLNERGMNPAIASDDGCWRYLQMVVVPDLVYWRWGSREGGGEINDKRQWSHTRRMWLKILWWYVHLSWQGSEESTRRVLEGNGANDISQLVERAGNGYRVPLYRAIMLRYSETDRRNGLLTGVLKLNVAMCGTVEPELTDGGIEGYVERLFEYLGE